MKILLCTVKNRKTVAPPIKLDDKVVNMIPKIPTIMRADSINNLSIFLTITTYIIAPHKGYPNLVKQTLVYMFL